MKTTTKKITLPKKPTTKRDKHMYDLGAKQQAEVFNQKDWSKFSPRKELLNDYQETFNQEKVIKKINETLGDNYQEPITDFKINWTVIALLVLGLIAFLYAMYGDQQALNAGLIH